MLSKIAKHLFAVAILSLSLSGLALAQQGAVRGAIKESGSGKPIEGALIEIYRLDIAQKFQTKTDKKGEYFHALQAFGEYVIAVSGQGYAPIASSKFRITSDQPVEQNFEMAPGDGSKLTLDQIRSSKPASPQGASAADAKKAQEEAARVAAEREKIAKENEKVKAQFGEMKKHFDAGLALNQKQDYEGAVNEFKQAVAIDDTQPTIYANLALALYNLGAIRFNNKQKDEAQELFKQSADYGEKATKMANPPSAEFLKIYGDSCDILFKNFHIGEFADKAIAAFTAGSEAETDPGKKYAMVNKIGSIYFTMGDVDKSMATYEKVLAADPNNLEALSGKALVLAATGEKPKMEQAIVIFQQVAEKAPAGSKVKTDAETNIKYLSDTLKIEVGPAKKEEKKKKK